METGDNWLDYRLATKLARMELKRTGNWEEYLKSTKEARSKFKKEDSNVERSG